MKFYSIKVLESFVISFEKKRSFVISFEKKRACYPNRYFEFRLTRDVRSNSIAVIPESAPETIVARSGV